MPLGVIGAGLGRTGTMSLKLALDQLGFGPTYHMSEVFKDPAAARWWADAADGGGPGWETIFAGYASSVDWPGASFYKTLADAYPDAKVILTERPSADWFKSARATIFNVPTSAGPPAFGRMMNAVIGRMFDGRLDDADHAIAVYERHNAEVRRVIPAGRLLVYEVSQGWEPLCAFLGVPIPEGDVPHVNSTAEFQARAHSSSDRPHGRASATDNVH
jgi:hypothetical protein